MVIEEPKLKMTNKDKSAVTSVGRTVKSALLKAQAESRVVIGLSEAVNTLAQDPEGTLFCLLSQSAVGDSAMHMHEVLLEAFCYEHDIYVIKVDSAEKLSRILGHAKIERCALVQKPTPEQIATTVETDEASTSGCSSDESEISSEASGSEVGDIELYYNKLENALVDHCEAYWDAPQQPVIKLPEM